MALCDGTHKNWDLFCLETNTIWVENIETGNYKTRKHIMHS